MSSTYLLFFRFVLFETLILQAQYAPGAESGGGRLWALIGFYAFCTSGIFWLRRRGRIPAAADLWSFLLDIAAISFILLLSRGTAPEFYIAFFLVVVMSCMLQNVLYSFIIGGLACLVFGAMTFPGFHGPDAVSYLLRLSLLLTTSLFSTVIADTTRRAKIETEDVYRRRLEWLERLSLAGRMVSAVLHEIKTPLNTVMLGVEYVKALAARPDSGAQAASQLDLILEEAQRAATILSDFLDFAKPSDLVLEPVPLRALVLKGFEKASVGIDKEAIIFEEHLDPEAVVEASSRHLIEVFVNLVDNAIEAMPLGGSLTVSQRTRGAEIDISFADTGLGIPNGRLAGLFEPFVTSHGEEGGHGLGLFITRWIVEKHGGAISLASEGPKRGATATVTLRLCAPGQPNVQKKFG